MLKVTQLSTPQGKWKVWQDFDPFQASWIVSDLRSKIELQTHLLKERDGIPGDSVLRATEFWRQIFYRAYPTYQILPVDWTSVVADKTLQSDEIVRHPSLRGTVVKLMNFLAPVLFHSERAEILADFLRENPSAHERLGTLFPAAISLFDEILKNHWMIESWIPAALENWGLPEAMTFPPLYFDLGASLTSVEADLIEELGRRGDVHVLIPAPAFTEQFQFLLAPGNQLFDRAGQRDRLETDEIAGETHYLKFSGRLAEVKHSVARVREWLDDGVPLSEIALITPFFEEDFTVLEEYFRVEGIPLRRTSGLRVQTLASVQCALARLRLSKNDLQFSDLLLSLRQGSKDRFEKMSAAFQEAMEPGDLSRLEGVSTQTQAWRWREQEIGLREFLLLLEKVWPEEGPGALGTVVSDLFESTPSHWHQSVNAWLNWLEKRISRLELSAPEASQGLQIVPLKSADLSPWTHRIFLGLVEKLPDLVNSLLTAEEISQWGWKYGFFLAHPEQTILQFELQWLVSQATEVSEFYYPSTDWSGGINSPQPFWLKGAGKVGVATPKACRWDEIQSHQDLNATDSRAQGLRRDLAMAPVTPLPSRDLSFSVSSLERFRDCPFIFAAEKQFSLLDEPLVDLAFDRRGTGQFNHKLAEKLLASVDGKINWEISEADLQTLLLEIKKELADFSIEESLWPTFAKRASIFARQFLAFEKEMAERYPSQDVLARELRFEFYYRPAEKQWSREPSEGAIRFRGQIDRVSGVRQGPSIVYDYKNTTSARHEYGAWLKENNLQLAFYSWALNEGLIQSDGIGPVVAACYYNLKKLERSIGFQGPEGVGLLYEKTRPRKIERPEIEKMWSQSVDQIVGSMNEATAGVMEPRPRKPEVCPRCQWKNVCRAPHLN